MVSLFSNNKSIASQTRSAVAAMSPAPSQNWQTALNNLILYWQSNGTWSEIDCMLGLPCENQQNSLVDIILPSRIATESGSPNWLIKNSYYGNASNMYIDTNYNTATNGIKFTSTNNGITVFSREDSAEASIDTGNFDGTNGNWIASEYSDNKQYARTGNTSAGALNNNSTGVNTYLYSSGSLKQYNNGVLINTTAITATSLVNGNMYALGARTSGDRVANALLLPSSKKLCFFIYHSGNVNPTFIKTGIDNFLMQINAYYQYAGFGDSVTIGFNATSQSASWFNQYAINKNAVPINYGVSGMAITPGSLLSAVFNNTSIPKKSSYWKKLVFAFGLNCTREYAAGNITLVQIYNAYQASFNQCVTNGFNLATEVLGITGYYIQNNAFYTIAQYNAVCTQIIACFNANGVPYVNNFPAIALDSGGVHPAGDAGYLTYANWVTSNS